MHEGHEDAYSGLLEGKTTANTVAKLYNSVTKRQTTILPQIRRYPRLRKAYFSDRLLAGSSQSSASQ